ncbi:MAG: hypothetical protein BGO78_14195 [Chloroflexi bacterium 44-23]|nr:MAG: hypothetical protein BGO78_14195 [Chloroflexi bacterium 44-23]
MVQVHNFSDFKSEFEGVLLPFLTSRAILVLTGLLSYLYRASDLYPLRKAVEQGWHFTPYRLLDMWARWDSGWYLSIVFDGLRKSEGLTNLAFFPLYPFLMRAGNYFLFDFKGHRTTFVLIGILISNLAFLGALLILRKVLLRLGYSESFARGTLWLLLITPFSFFFSAVYTEGIFIFLVLATVWFCMDKRWLLCAVTAALLMVTRPLAQLVVIPIAISYLVQNKGRIHWRDVFSFALVPLVAFGYIWTLYLISGDWLMIINSHSGWGHQTSNPWAVLTHIDLNYLVSGYINISMVLMVTGLLLLAIWKYPLKQWSLFGLFLVITPLFLGVSTSLGRYTVTSFTAMIALQGLLENRPNLRRLVMYGMLAVQALLFAGFVRFYWVG